MELENSGILPSQYADAHRQSRGFEGERRLLFAAFESGLKDCQDYLAKGKLMSHTFKERRRLETLEWLRDDSEGLLSFRWYCAAFGLDCASVRKALASGLIIVRRASPVNPLKEIDPNEYHRRYRARHRERLRKYHREYGRKRRGVAL